MKVISRNQVCGWRAPGLKIVMLFCQPACCKTPVTLCVQYMALKIIVNNSLLRLIYKTAARKAVFLLHHGDPSIQMLSFISTGMR